MPAGRWSKIRLRVADAELVRADERAIAPEIAGGGVVELDLREPIAVFAGEPVFVELDLDAEKSLLPGEVGSGGVRLRPVVFADSTAIAAGPPVRIEGEIDAIGTGAEEIRACGTHAVLAAGGAAAEDGCVAVAVAPGTRITGADGEPAAAGDLAIGDAVAALGRLRAGARETPVLDAVWVASGELAVAGVARDASAVAASQSDPSVRLRGVVTQRFDAAEGTLEIQALTATAVAPACIAFERRAAVVRIVDAGDRLRAAYLDPAALRKGEAVEVFGHPGERCFAASALVSSGGGAP